MKIKGILQDAFLKYLQIRSGNFNAGKNDKNLKDLTIKRKRRKGNNNLINIVIYRTHSKEERNKK
jgi:hypothetical protein